MTPRKREATLSASSSVHNSSKTRTRKWGVTPVTTTTPCTLLQLTVVMMSAIALTTLWSSTAAAAFTVPGAPSPAHRRPHDVVRDQLQPLQRPPIQDDDDYYGDGPPPLLWMPPQEDENDAKTATTATATNPRTSLRAKLGLSSNDDETGASSTLVPLPNSSSSNSSRSSNSSSSIKVVGHRGAMYEFLENTREGFVHCAQLGCHAVELDVFFLPRDGSVVVFHGTDDDNNNEQHVPRGLLREYCLGYDNDATTSQRHTSIVDLTYPESQLLRFNPEFAEFGCPPSAVEQGRIPLLQDVLLDLQAFPDLEIKIELKGHGTVQPVLDIVERLQMQRQCSYSSFDLPQLQQLRQLRPDATLYRTGALFAGVPPANFLTLARDCGASEIHLQYDECTTACIAAIHHAGFTSMAWFRGPRGMQSDAQYKYTDDMHHGEDERCYQALVETGVHQICCNRPNVLLQLLLTEQQQQQQTWTVG